MYDIAFISYNESNADDNYRILSERFPLAKRIHGIHGIHQAHIFAAHSCHTKMFWVVDADIVVSESFKFNHTVSEWESRCVHIYRSLNPVNGLIYGNGGVKLLPRLPTINMDVVGTDMTTNISPDIIVMDETAGTTAFNVSAFSAWRSGFRECAKLSSKVIYNQVNDETDHRLAIWQTVGSDELNGEHVIAGAKLGRAFGEKHSKSISHLNLINDFAWLREQFNIYINRKTDIQ